MSHNKEKIHLVTVVSRMNLGGPAVLITDLANGLDKSRISHTIITGRCEANEVDYLQTHHVDCKVVYVEDMARSIFLLNDLRSFIKIFRILRAEKPNVVHTHMSKAGLIGRIAAKIASPRARVIHTYHGHLLYGYFSRFVTRIIVLVEKLLSRITDDLIAITPQVKMDLLSLGIGTIDKWRVINLGIEIRKRIDRPSLRRSLSIPTDKFVCLWIGRFTIIKNPMLAIEAFRNLVPYPQFQLIMLGGGELLMACKDFVRHNELPVTFLGWKSDIYTHLPAADLLLMTSTNEGLGMVMLEAASQGIPTISTDVGGVSTFIKDEVTGYFESGDPRKFAARIKDIANDREKLRLVGENAFSLVSKEFSSKVFVANHESMYLES